MIQIEELQATWRRIEVPGSDVEFPARELSQLPLPYGSPLLTVDVHGLRHLLLAVPEDLIIQEDSQSGGVHVLEQYWGLDGDRRRFVDVVCRKPHLNDVFDLIALDIFDALKDDPHHPDRAAHITLARWREFVNEIKEPSINVAAITGLYGELWFLRELTRRDPGALSLWQGPFGGRYDFYSGMTAVEIKTTKQHKGKSVTVHGHDQLDDPPNGSLYLARLQVEQGVAAKEALIDVADELSVIGCDMRRFYGGLLQIGFTRQQLEAQENVRFNLLAVDVYLVDDNFPRITTRSFKGDALPAGIISIRYDIDLTSNQTVALSDNERDKLFNMLVSEIK